MAGQILRIILLIFLMFFLVSDLVELISYFPACSIPLAPLVQRLNSFTSTTKSKVKEKTQPSHGNEEFISSKAINKNNFHTKSAIITNSGLDELKINLKKGKLLSGKGSAKEIIKNEFTDAEKQQLLELKAHWSNVMQEYCLPKLVCELHASLSDGSVLTEAEKGLLSLIKETSLGTSGEVVSKYHFAAHMGQLLSGVEGNGCHNLYPSCPISGNKVLQMVKKVRIR